MGGRMGGQMDGKMDRQKEGWINGCKDEWMDR